MNFVKKYLILGGLFFIFMILTGIISAIPSEEFYQGLFVGITAYNAVLCLAFFSAGVKVGKEES